MSDWCPFYPSKRTSIECSGMSVMGQTATYAPQQKRRYSITSSAAGSPEKQKINDDEGCDYATGAEGEHVANVVSGHALARLDCSFDDPFVMPFRHQGLLFAEIDTAPTGAFSGINAIAVRPFLRVRPRNFQ